MASTLSTRTGMDRKIVLGVVLGALLAGGCQRGATGRPPLPDKPEALKEAVADAEKQAPVKPLRLMQFSLIFLNARYVDPSRINWQKMAVYGIDAIQNMTPEVVAHFDKRIDDVPDSVRLRVGKATRDFDLRPVTSLARAYQMSEDVYNFVLANLIEPKNETELEYAMINGMFSTLDPHTNLLPPYAFEDVMTGNGGFAGCGFVVGLRAENLVVISPTEGGPAWRAGIKPGDVIVRIDDESTENMPLQDAVDRLRGEAGTEVTLYVKRRGWVEPRAIGIKREVIRIKSVTSHAFSRDKIGYIKIKSFDQTTAQEVATHLKTLTASFGQDQRGMRGLIIDLRNNSGGLLTQSIEVAELFLRRGDTIVSVEGATPATKESTRSRRDGEHLDYPIAILINVGSASASEIVAGALQYHRRATVIGQRSFGKGSVQILKDNPDGSAIKITSAQYLTPGDISIQGVGIVPDIALIASYVEPEAISLLESQRARRESSLEQSLHSDKTTTRSSEQSLHYLYRENADDEKRAKDLGLSKYDLRSTEDYTPDEEIDLARRYLIQAKSNDAAEILSQSSSFFETQRSDYKTSLVLAFKKLGVDWTPSEGVACSQFEWGLKYDDKETKPGGAIEFRADGEERTLAMWVKNTCESGSLSQISAVLSSNNIAFDEREFAFGKIAPGQTQEWPIKVKIPKSMSSRDDKVVVNFYKNAEEALRDSSFQAKIVETDRPRFSYAYWIDDIRRGNADGTLSRNESVDMYVRVANEGEVTADKVKVHIANESGSGVLLVKGRAVIESIAPGESEIVKLSFDVSKDRPQKPPSKRIKRDKPFNPDEVSFRLSIVDDAYDSSIEQDVVFPVNAEALAPQAPQFELREIRAGAKVVGTLNIDMPMKGDWLAQLIEGSHNGEGQLDVKASNQDNTKSGQEQVGVQSGDQGSSSASAAPGANEVGEVSGRSKAESDLSIGKFATNQIVEMRTSGGPQNEAYRAVCWREGELEPCGFIAAKDVVDLTKDAAVAMNQASASEATAGDKGAPSKSSGFVGSTYLEAPRVKFLNLSHTMNVERAKADIMLTDNDGLNHFEAYVWTQDELKVKAEKLEYDIVEGREARISIDVPIRIGDNSVVIVVRDNRATESVGIFHINREK